MVTPAGVDGRLGTRRHGAAAEIGVGDESSLDPPRPPAEIARTRLLACWESPTLPLDRCFSPKGATEGVAETFLGSTDVTS